MNGGTGHGPRTNPLDFDGDPMTAPPILLHVTPVVDFQRGSNTLAAFARWQHYNTRAIKHRFQMAAKRG